MKNRIFNLALCSFLLAACTATSNQTSTANLGRESNNAALIESLEKPGLIRFEKIAVANWQVPLSGLLNLDHPKAISAGLIDKEEDIQLFLYVLTHHSKGTFLIDSGISERFIDAENNEDVSFIVKKAMNLSNIEVIKSTKEIVNSIGSINGVFLTHIHLDHIMGLLDVAPGVPVFTGPGDASSEMLTHAASRGSTDRLLANAGTLREWQFGPQGIVDVFGDGALWALHVPGHTPGATAYLANTASGPQLMIGDATHTRWGWDNQVEPGSYTKDIPQSVKSLARLAVLVSDHPKINVHPGHQP
ncbi:MAG: N-acyl homoserine lactone hydrolase [Cryomorphaceae bacterium]|jgi:N-acyl homoserine lactone hydrolase